MRTSANLQAKALMTVLFLFSGIAANAQSGDGIYDDIYQPPTYNTGSPLDGYSTHDQDDYYRPQDRQDRYTRPTTTDQYVDESGNTYITNNYYGDVYDDYDYFYASRINRFHRPVWGFGYYDPFYTNLYWYNYDPFFYGTSIYAGYGWGMGWGMGWGWNSWGMGWGWNRPWGMGWGYSPYCWGGWGMGWNTWGMGMGWGGYGMGYNHGYWNGYYDALAWNGYYNTYDRNSGIYYGHRGGGGMNGGSGSRQRSFSETYNSAASAGKVSHANRDNILQTADARPVRGTFDGRSNGTVRPLDASRSNDAVRQGGSTNPVRATDSRTADVQRPTERSVDRFTPATGRGDAIRQEGGNVRPQTGQPQRTPDMRSPQQAPQRGPQVQQPQRAPSPTYQVPDRQRSPQTQAPQRTPAPNVDRSRPNVYQAPQRETRPQATQPQRDTYQRGSAPQMQRPDYNTPQRVSPHAVPQQPQRDMRPQQAPQRDMRPQQQAPTQRNVAPQRNAPAPHMSPSPGPSRGVSPSPGPSRGGSFGSPGGGGGGSRGGGAPSGGGRRGG